MALLGRTPLGDDEQSLFSAPILVNSKIENPIFLYETRQLDYREGRPSSSDSLPVFWTDLQSFLGLKEPLVPNRFGAQAHASAGINICDERYQELRQHLVNIGVEASTWILQYFLDKENVFVSDREYFKSLVETWKTDPCLS